MHWDRKSKISSKKIKFSEIWKGTGKDLEAKEFSQGVGKCNIIPNTQDGSQHEWKIKTSNWKTSLTLKIVSKN